MVNEIRVRERRGLDKGCGLKFYVSFQVRQETAEKYRRTYRPKRFKYKDEGNSLKILNNKNQYILFDPYIDPNNNSHLRSE